MSPPGRALVKARQADRVPVGMRSGKLHRTLDARPPEVTPNRGRARTPPACRRRVHGATMARIVNLRSVLAVRDLQAATRYYVDVLGFTREPIDAAGWSFLTRDSVRVMLGECATERPATDIGDHSYVAYWNVDDVDQFYTEIAG